VVSIGDNILDAVDITYRDKLKSIFTKDGISSVPISSIFPISKDSPKTSWVYVELADSSLGVLKYLVKSIILTEASTIDHKIAILSADSIYNSSLAILQIRQLNDELDKIKQTIVEELSYARESLTEAILAAKKAEEAATDNKSVTDLLRQQVESQFSVHTKEITKLMTSDVIHDSRMEIFENHVKKTTSEAIMKIMDQADVSGKRVFTRMLIPVIITILLTLLSQYVIIRYVL
jgi:hypothetical protein